MNNVTPHETEQVETIAANVGYLLTVRGWSWNRLATEAGVAQATISRLKNARFEPGVFTMRRLSQALDTSIEWLCEPHESKNIAAAG